MRWSGRRRRAPLLGYGLSPDNDKDSAVKTGKLNFRDFVTSVGDDILRLIIKTQIIPRPPAEGIPGMFRSGGAGPAAAAGGGPGGFLNFLGTAGSSIMGWGGAGSLIGSGLTSLGGMLPGAFGSGLAMTGQVGILQGFLNGAGALASGAPMAGLGAMLTGDASPLALHLVLSKAQGPIYYRRSSPDPKRNPSCVIAAEASATVSRTACP